jgi:molecular chaperone DnaK (HSP70)
MPTEWAIDFGTTNTVVAVAEAGNVRVVALPELGRQQPSEQPTLVPSAIYIEEVEARRFFLLRQEVLRPLIGQPALTRNFDGRSPAFRQSFKLHLGHEPHRPAVHVKKQALSVCESAGDPFLQGRGGTRPSAS